MLICLLDAPEQQFSHQEIEEDVSRLPRAPPNPRLSTLQTAKHDVSPHPRLLYQTSSDRTAHIFILITMVWFFPPP